MFKLEKSYYLYAIIISTMGTLVVICVKQGHFILKNIFSGVCTFEAFLGTIRIENLPSSQVNKIVYFNHRKQVESIDCLALCIYRKHNIIKSVHFELPAFSVCYRCSWGFRWLDNGFSRKPARRPDLDQRNFLTLYNRR